MMMNIFSREKLACSYCSKEIKENEKFSVTLSLPAEKKMPVGVLDKVLLKHADEILCNRCRLSDPKN